MFRWRFVNNSDDIVHVNHFELVEVTGTANVDKSSTKAVNSLKKTAIGGTEEGNKSSPEY